MACMPAGMVVTIGHLAISTQLRLLSAPAIAPNYGLSLRSAKQLQHRDDIVIRWRAEETRSASAALKRSLLPSGMQ